MANSSGRKVHRTPSPPNCSDPMWVCKVDLAIGPIPLTFSRGTALPTGSLRGTDSLLARSARTVVTSRRRPWMLAVYNNSGFVICGSQLNFGSLTISFDDASERGPKWRSAIDASLAAMA